MGSVGLLKDIYTKLIGGSAPPGAASPNGDIGQMVKYLTSNTSLVPNAVEVFPQLEASIGFSGTGAWGTRAGPAASSQATATQPNAMAFHPDGTYVASALAASPYVVVWNFSDAGYGSKLSNPGTLPAGQGNGVAWHPNGNWLAVAHNTSPYISVYAFDKVAGSIGAKVSNPASLPSGTSGRCVAFAPDGNWLAVGNNTTGVTGVEVYAFNPSTGAIGAKVSNPATGLAGPANGVAWSATGAYLAAADSASPYVIVWPWNGAFGTKFGNPGTLPTNSGNSVAWRGDNLLVLGEAGSPYIHAWAFSAAGFGTKWSNPGTLPAGAAQAVAITPNQNYVVAALSVTPYLVAYPITLTAFGTKLSNPGSTPGAATYGIAARPGAGTLHVTTASNNTTNSHYSYPFVQVGYTWVPTLATVGRWSVAVATNPVRVRPVIGGVAQQPTLLPAGFSHTFTTDVDSLFIGPDTDGGTGTFKIIASGR